MSKLVLRVLLDARAVRPAHTDATYTGHDVDGADLAALTEGDVGHVLHELSVL